MACRAVSSYVNKPGNEGARCLDGPEKDNPTLWDV
jgi:hypothetical protein